MASLSVDKADLELIRHKTGADVWAALNNQSLFITGGTGFIGCWLLEALLDANDALALNLSISVLSRNPDAFQKKVPHLANAKTIQLIKGDVTNLSAIGGKYDSIIHAATDVIQPKADPVAVYKDIELGTDEILALAQRSGASRFLLTSSGAIYGRQPPEMTHIDESFSGTPDLTNPKSGYGLGKRYSEWLTQIKHQETGLDIKIARCFAFAGPYMALDAQFAIGNFIGDCISGRDIIIGGDGTPYRSYLYAADLIVWLLTILIKGDNKPYNVGSGKGLQIAELAHEVRAALKTDNKIIIQKTPDARKLPERYLPAVERAASLGLQEYTSLSDAIVKTANWNKKAKGLSV